MQQPAAIVGRADGDDPIKAAAIKIVGIAKGLRNGRIGVVVAEHAREHTALAMAHHIETGESPSRTQRVQLLLERVQGHLGAMVQRSNRVRINRDSRVPCSARAFWPYLTVLMKL